jgi:hypothetical protein
MELLRDYTPPVTIEEAATRVLARDNLSDQHIEKLRACLHMTIDLDVISRREQIDAAIEQQKTAESSAQTQSY